MKILGFSFFTGSVLTLVCSMVCAQSDNPKIEEISMVPRLTISSMVGTSNMIEYADELATNLWRVLTNVVVSNSPYVFVDLTAPPSPKRFYRVSNLATNHITPNMVLVPAGSFSMGDPWNEAPAWLPVREVPVHTVYVSAIYMDKYEVMKALWDDVKAWAVQHGYSFDNVGYSKAFDHPVQGVNWYDVVKWCNARSEMEGRIPAYYTDASQTSVYRSGQVDVQNGWVKWNSGYRLPTEAEWEKAARGGASGHRFPWSDVDTITQNQANYYSFWSGGAPYYSYDLNRMSGYNYVGISSGYPYTSPAGSFTTNGYGLYDMAGNVDEWCWDWLGSYPSDSQTDPLGPTSGVYRILRGGNWFGDASECRVARRGAWTPTETYDRFGFRSVLPSGQ
jgi:formylglycine-generating enzyme